MIEEKAILIGILALKGFFVDNSGATYRTNRTMGHFGMSCQYWKEGLRYMHPGESIILTGVGKYWWDDSKECGRCLLVRFKDRWSSVVIADYCPECTPRQLDLNEYSTRWLLGGQLTNLPVLSVAKFKCVWKGKPMLVLDEGSSVYTWYIIPLNFPEPLKGIQVLNQSANHDKFGRWVIAFKVKFPGKHTSAKVFYSNREYQTLVPTPLAG